MAHDAEFAALLALPQEIAHAVTEAIKGLTPASQLQAPGRASDQATTLLHLPNEIARTLKDSLRGLAEGRERGHGVGGVAGDFSLGMTMTRMGGLLEPVAGVVKEFVGAFKAAFGPFEQMTEVAAHFVDAVDPNSVRMLDQHFRDLNATIGVALKPVIDDAREVVRYLSSALLPVMRQLQPIVAELSKEIKSVLFETIDKMGVFLDDMMPVIRAVKDILVGLIGILKDVFDGVHVLMAAIIEMAKAIFESFGGGSGATVKDFMASFREAVQQVIASLLIFAARLMAMVGFTRGIDAMIKALDPQKARKENADGLAVAQNAMFKSIGELSRGVMASMFAASGAMQTKTPAEQTNDWLKGIKGDLENLKNSPAMDRSAIKEMIVNAFVDGFDKIKAEIISHLPSMPHPLENARGFAAGGARAASGAARGFAGGIIGGMF